MVLGPQVGDQILVHQFLDLVVPDMESESGVFQATVLQGETEATIEISPRDAE